MLPIQIQKNRHAIITILDDSPVQSAHSDWHQCIGNLNAADYAELVTILQDTENIDETNW
jgi:hypothetical protein